MGTNWLSIRCHYAVLSSSILKQFYGQKSLTRETSDGIQDLEKQLDDWLRMMPCEFRCTEELVPEFSGIGHLERRARLDVFFQHHQAILSIYREEEADAGTQSPSARHQRRLASARAVLAATTQITANDILSNL